MKILLVGIYVPPQDRKTGGPTAVFSNLVDSIIKTKLNHKVDIISQSYLRRGKIKLSNSTIIHFVPILKINELLSFVSMLLRKRYNVINVQGVSELNVIAAVFGKISGATIVYSCHGLILNEMRLGRKYPIRLLVEERLIVKFSDVLVTVSAKFKSKIQKILRYPEERIYVIYNGISEDWLQDYPDACLVKKNSQYLLFVGAPVIIKGFDLLLRAFSILKKRYKHLQLLVVGKKPKEDIMKNVGDAISSITFVSDVEKTTLRKIYKEATVLVLPSREDSFPLVILEGLSQGLPVVISDQVGVSEIIKDGKNGLIFKSNNVDDLTTCLERILTDEDLRKRISEEGRKLATSRTWSHVLNDYFELFKMIANKTSGRRQWIKIHPHEM